MLVLVGGASLEEEEEEGGVRHDSLAVNIA